MLEDGLLELKICRQSASPGERELQGERVAGRANCSGGVTFVVALICSCLRLCFIVIVICFCLLRAGLDKEGMKNAC